MLRKLSERADLADVQWIELLSLLFPTAGDHSETILAFLHECLQDDATEMWAIEHQGETVGLVTVGRFAMPRYGGYGYEIQEIAVSDAVRGKGLGTAALHAIHVEYSKRSHARKLVVRTNGPRAAALYSRFFDRADLVTYQRWLSPL